MPPLVHGKLTAPLRDRFNLMYEMSFYKEDEMVQIIISSCEKLKLKINDQESLFNIAKRCRGTPRIANNLLKNIRDFAQIHNNNTITNNLVDAACNLEQVDIFGLHPLDKRYLYTLFKVYHAGPAGSNALASSMNIDIDTITHYIEPYLLREGFIARTNKGRMLTSVGLKYILNQIE